MVTLNDHTNLTKQQQVAFWILLTQNKYAHTLKDLKKWTVTYKNQGFVIGAFLNGPEKHEKSDYDNDPICPLSDFYSHVNGLSDSSCSRCAS